MMRPNFEDLKRRIEPPTPSEASWLEETEQEATQLNGAEHPESEKLCGYADGVLRREYPAIWKNVNSHLKKCLECQSEVKQLRLVIPLSLRVKNGFTAIAEEALDIAKEALDMLLRYWRPIATVAAILMMIAIPFVFTGYRLGSAQPKAEVQILREENERLRVELAEERAKKEEFKEANRKLIERFRSLVSKGGIASPPLSVPYTNPQVQPVFPEVPYTDPRVQPVFPEVPYTPPQQSHENRRKAK